MELPAVIILPYFFIVYSASPVGYIFLILWENHYITMTQFMKNIYQKKYFFFPKGGFNFVDVRDVALGV